MGCLRGWWRAVVVRGASKSRARAAVVKGVLYAQRGVNGAGGRVTASFRNKALENGLLLIFLHLACAAFSRDGLCY